MSNRKIDATRAVIELLAEIFPATFHIYERKRKPLRIGVFAGLVAATAGAITAKELHAALRYCTSNSGYLQSLRAGTARIDLDGELCGTVSREEAQHASERLEVRARKRAAMVKAKPAPAKPAPRPASKPALPARSVVAKPTPTASRPAADPALTRSIAELGRAWHERVGAGKISTKRESDDGPSAARPSFLPGSPGQQREHDRDG